MQLDERNFIFLLTITLTTLVLSSVAIAAVASVELEPTVFVQRTDTEFSLSVVNEAGDNINEVELTLPQIDNQPFFIVKEISQPAGWTFETRYTLGAPSPFKIIWNADDAGISQGKSLSFKFITSSNEQGTFSFKWRVADLKDAESSGSIEVKSAQQAFSDFQVGIPDTIVAGEIFDLTVTALNIEGNKKTDFTGTVTLTTSDSSAILPSEYDFQTSDAGTKTLKVKLKTIGEQEISVTDGEVTKTVIVNVLPADISFIDLSVNPSTVSPTGIVKLSVWAHDVYNNSWDVTNDSSFQIDDEAGGEFVNDTYQSEVEGIWTVVANYSVGTRGFLDGDVLIVTSAPLPEEPEEEPEEIVASAEITSDDLVQVPVNRTKLFTLKVKNTGEVDLTDVNVFFSGVPEDWMMISPTDADINKEKTQKFTATIFVPEMVDPVEVDFLVLSKDLSSDVFSAEKTVTFNFTEEIIEEKPTGRFVLSRNLTYLGIAILIAIVLILLFWVLFLREKPKKKKGE